MKLSYWTIGIPNRFGYVICIVEGNDHGATHVTRAKWGSDGGEWMDGLNDRKGKKKSLERTEGGLLPPPSERKRP